MYNPILRGDNTSSFLGVFFGMSFFRKLLCKLLKMNRNVSLCRKENTCMYKTMHVTKEKQIKEIHGGGLR